MLKPFFQYHGQFKTCIHFIATVTDTCIQKKIEFHIPITLSNDGMNHIPVQNFVFLSVEYATTDKPAL